MNIVVLRRLYAQSGRSELGRPWKPLDPARFNDRNGRRPKRPLGAVNAEILLTNKTVLSREILQTLPRLRYIGGAGHGATTSSIWPPHANGACR